MISWLVFSLSLSFEAQLAIILQETSHSLTDDPMFYFYSRLGWNVGLLVDIYFFYNKNNSTTQVLFHFIFSASLSCFPVRTHIFFLHMCLINLLSVSHFMTLISVVRKST